MVIRELERSAPLYGGFKSLHEGYAVLLEEVEELWAEIKKKKPNKENLLLEITQVAVMAFKLFEYTSDNK